MFERMAENQMERAEVRNERAAEREMERGDFRGAAAYEGRAERLDNERNQMEVGAEVRAENRAMNDLARGNVGGYEREMNKANRIENRRENQNFGADMNDGVGMRSAFQPDPYIAPVPYVEPGGARVENNLMNAEVRQEQIAAYDQASGNYYGAAVHEERARELDAARNNMEVQDERRAENRAINDLARGDIGGYIANEVQANRIENRREEENYIANANSPAYVQPQPAYVQPQSGYVQPQPGYSNQPAYNQLGYNQYNNQPAYNQPEYNQPAYVQPPVIVNPGMGQPGRPVVQPVMPQPVMQQQPIYYQEQDACACNLL